MEGREYTFWISELKKVKILASTTGITNKGKPLRRYDILRFFHQIFQFNTASSRSVHGYSSALLASAAFLNYFIGDGIGNASDTTYSILFVHHTHSWYFFGLTIIADVSDLSKERRDPRPMVIAFLPNRNKLTSLSLIVVIVILTISAAEVTGKWKRS